MQSTDAAAERAGTEEPREITRFTQEHATVVQYYGQQFVLRAPIWAFQTDRTCTVVTREGESQELPTGYWVATDGKSVWPIADDFMRDNYGAAPPEVRGDADAAIFAPHWPQGVQCGAAYAIESDDCDATLRVVIGNDGDAHVSVSWPEGWSPGVRFCTHQGGGKNGDARQAVLWLAFAMMRAAPPAIAESET